MSNQEKPLAIFLMGPTASGKTDLALALADHLPVDLISVDSALVYRDMDIGTAKPDAQTLAAYPHALIDIRDPSETYSAADFCQDAQGLIQKTLAQGRIPLLVGGTMMYFNALQQGMADLPQADAQVRQTLLDKAEQEGDAQVYAELQAVDAMTAQRLQPSDRQRVHRALEVYYLTGIPLSQHFAQQQEQTLPFRVLALGLLPDNRAWLHQRIEQRFDLMLEQGFEEEVKHLYQRGDLHLGMPSIRCVGYRQMWQYLQGELSFDEMRYKGIVATRQLAKRQYTWLRGWPELQVLQGSPENNLKNALQLV
ncbi:tRNA (adenosine(37)-N6)-dimethylallyltransferase MiaA [Nitrincola tapanii]|uniref:tRNA dimethylallyltransferase n=1 Tax=Nitrincola tapanii TaxID=1708751 RepID=A0A5A9W2K9_9GAMM|nr:tRNA (adenosine(37)-N6)-dimethylallyltransferase MiaA [Nitrincola tapanii]KAA0874744.1 tRNA (adenosine(37)-N6)-dimethylallyltransferase MiaA [Nitrincola tapanii]